MKPLLLILLACAATRLLATPGWLTSYDKALEFSARSGRPVLLNFTGSDWCGWCKKMKAETLSQPAFIKFASSNLILVELDFPQSVPQTPELKEANAATKDKFKVGGYPTFILVNSQGNEIGRQVGYLQGGVPEFVGKVSKWIGRAKAANGETASATPAEAVATEKK